jgi:purine-nucleoside phosphorylase
MAQLLWQHKQWEQTAEWLSRRFAYRPQLGLIAGSGISSALGRSELLWCCSYEEVPHFPRASVEGHPGELRLMRLGGRPVLVFAGRFHLYEGYTPQEVVAPVVVAWYLGVRALIVTNAAGALSPERRVGELVLLRGILDLTFRPLPVGAWGVTVGKLCPEWRQRVRQRAAVQGILCSEGVYAGVVGPSYETPAEVRMLQSFGADVVGMSTVHELLCAAALQMRSFALSVVTNWAAGLAPVPLSHAEVLSTLSRVAEEVGHVLELAAAEAPV